MGLAGGCDDNECMGWVDLGGYGGREGCYNAPDGKMQTWIMPGASGATCVAIVAVRGLSKKDRVRGKYR